MQALDVDGWGYDEVTDTDIPNLNSSCTFQMAGFLGMQDVNADAMTGKLEEMLPIIRQVNEQFRDPVSEIVTTNIRLL